MQMKSGVHWPSIPYPEYADRIERARQCLADHGLEEVVRKATGAAAEWFSIKDRGLLQKDFAADITVFDWEKVRDSNTTEKTSETPTGIDCVFINGQPALANGHLNTSILAGRVL